MEKEKAGQSQQVTGVDGHIYLWELADFEKIPYLPENRLLLESIASQYDMKESPNERLREGGHLLYHYKKLGPRTISHQHSKAFKVNVEKNLEDGELQDVRFALGGELAQSALMEDTAGGFSKKPKRQKVALVDLPQKTDKQKWVKEATSLKHRMGKSMDAAHTNVIKIKAKVAEGVISPKYLSKLDGGIKKMAASQDRLLAGIVQCGHTADASFAKMTMFKNLMEKGKGELETFDDEHLSMSTKLAA